jgi:DNA-directed RNA polymerase specialized sigma24 family protein
MSIGKLELSDLRKYCGEEINLYFQGQNTDGRYCFELLRRCLQERDQNAWEHAYILFEPQVTRWVRSHRLFFASGEEVSYFVDRALEKMWISISPEKFSRFLNIQSLLRYLKMCVGSVIIDHYRNQERINLEELSDRQGSVNPQQESNVENYVFNKVNAEEIWRLAKSLVNSEREYDVLYGSFILGLKPSEIYTHFPDKFSNVKEIYRIKENMLSRFRRNEELRIFLGTIAGEVE